MNSQYSPLSKICSNISRRFIPPTNNKVYFINTGDVLNGNFLHEDLSDWSDLPGQAKKAIEKNDILYSEIRPGNGRYAFVSREINNAVVSTKFMVIKSSKGVHPKYLYHYLISPRLEGEFKRIADSRSGTFPQITFNSISHLEIRLPEIETQRNISNFLDSLQNKIELYEETNKTLEEIAKALFKSWFIDFDPVKAKSEGRSTGFPYDISELFPDSFEDSELGPIPSGWGISKIGDISENFDRKRVPLSKEDRSKRKGDFPYYGATGIFDYIDDFLFDGIYLLIGEDGSVEKEDGTAFTQYINGKIWVNNHAHVLTGIDPVSTEFLYCFFQFFKINPYITGAVQLKLSQGRMNMISLPLADNNCLKIFDQQVKPIFSKIIMNKNESLILKSIRNALLPKLITGELGISDAEKMIDKVVI